MASFVCKLTSLPQISPNALASVFDSKAAYPTFFRGIASIVSAARSLARVVRQFGYARLAVIATTATVDQTTVQAFQAEATVLGLQIVTSQIITTGTCDAMAYQMAQLKASKMRVFGLFGLVGDARCIATAASKAGIWGEGFLWFGVASSLTDPTVWQNATGGTIPSFYRLFQNFIGTIATVDPNPPAYAAFAAAYTARPYAADFFSASGRAPNVMSALAYDAVFAMARAWHTAIEVQGKNVVAAPSSALAALRAVNFTGLSGNYYFDSNQNRRIDFDIVQPQNGIVVKIGICNSASGAFSVQLNGAVQWAGGAGAAQPPERDPFVPQSAGVGALNSAIVLAVGGGLVCAAMAAVTMHHRAAAAVKASSPLMMLLVLLGCFLAFASLPVGAVDAVTSSSQAADSACRAYPFIVSAAFILIFAPLLAKTSRIATIFGEKTLKVVVLTDTHLFALIGSLLAADLLINFVWLGVDPLAAVQIPVDDTYARLTCESPQRQAAFVVTLLVFKGALLVATLVMCWRVRKVPSDFNESRTIFAAVYQLTFVIAFVLPVAAYVSDPLVSQIARQAGLAVAVFACIGILFWPSLSAIYFPSSAASGGGFGGGSSNSRPSNASRNRVESVQLINCPSCGDNIADFVGRVKGFNSSRSASGVAGGGGGASRSNSTPAAAAAPVSSVELVVGAGESKAAAASSDADQSPAVDAFDASSHDGRTDSSEIESVEVEVEVEVDGRVQLRDENEASSSS